MTTPTEQHTRAFTLIELLVVIAIIGILSSVVLASLNSARTKSRDARRVSDVRQVQQALEFYYDENGDYPRANEWEQCSCSDTTCGTGEWFDILDPLVTQGFLPALPGDPINQTGTKRLCYEYLARSDASASSITCNGVPRSNYEYSILFSTEATTYDFPQVTAGSTLYDYCLLGPLK